MGDLLLSCLALGFAFAFALAFLVVIPEGDLLSLSPVHRPVGMNRPGMIA
jgi:hypothetical protein